MSDILGNVLVDQNNTDIIAGAKRLKGFLDLLQFRVRLDNQKVGTLCCSVTDTCQQESRDRILL
jgi:hypothetical protein